MVGFQSPRFGHAHYIASSPADRDPGAIGLVFFELINSICTATPWFSFGISTESGGTMLNEGLIQHKEGFGAQASGQDFYEVSL